MSTIWRFAPNPTLFRHFVDEARAQAGSVYGRSMYEVMRYWDDDDPRRDADERAFATARSKLLARTWREA